MSLPEAALINLEYKPFVYIRFKNIQINDEIFENYTRKYLELLLSCKKNKEKIYVIIDINEFETLPLPYLLKQAQFNKKIFKFNQKYLHCAYIYCKNKVFKNMIKMFMMVEKPAVPMRIIRSVSKLNQSILDNYNINVDINIFLKDLKNSKQNNNENYDNKNNEIDEDEETSNESIDELREVDKIRNYLDINKEENNLKFNYNDIISNLEN